MNNSPYIMPEEWDRIREHLANGPDHVHLDPNGVVIFNGGMMHPRAYLQIMEEESEDATVDILKHVKVPSPNDPIGIMMASLSGGLLLPWKPKSDEDK